MKTTDEYKTAVVCPKEHASAVVEALEAAHYRTTLVQRKAAWVHTDAPQRIVLEIVRRIERRV